MNCFPTNRRCVRFWAGLIFVLGLFTLSYSGLTQTSPAGRTNRPAPERFLLIIETSAAMQKRSTNVLHSVGQLFTANLLSQFHRGDTVGMWTYNNELHAGEFPLQRWTPTAGKEIMLATVQFVSQLRYSKQSRLAPVMAQLRNVVANSDKLTVILISDGSESPVGTPFDRQIAAAFKLNSAEQRSQAMPFVTILRAAKGEFCSFKVNTPPWPIELPAFPNEPAPVAPAPIETKPAPNVEVTPSTPPATPVVISNPPAVTPRTNTPAASVVTTPPVELPTNPPPAVTVSPLPSPTNITPATNPSPVLLSKPVATTTSADNKIPVAPILIGASIVLVGMAVLGLALLKRFRKEPRVSLITRSMNKDAK
jgi:hypothetical protein